MKQTVEPPKMIPYEVYYPYFEKVPANKKVKLRDYMNVRSLGATFQRNRISESKFNELKNFVEDLKIGSFSWVKECEIYDSLQQKVFMDSLTDLINSKDFQLLNNKKRSAIVEEQKRSYKQLN